ncbi:MAG: CPBP family intramembrane metalloprotease [Sphingobacteriales bacterium]|nr:CPBP family intramembrane metalloprotease [Sphingobacteriales bacterium]OJW03049.1 MAG: hypothetical protein BGO52_01735 [Sphingobacteriales bacterium 44-61]
MYDNDSKGISYLAGFFMLIAFVIAGMMFTQVITGPIWTGLTGKNISVLRDGLMGPEDAKAVKLIQSLSAILGFLVPTFVTAFLLHRRPVKLLGFEAHNMQAKQLGIVILIIGTALFVSSSLSFLTHLIPVSPSSKEFFDRLEENYNKQVSIIIDLKTVGDYILGLVIMALLPAFCEEVLFRSGFQNFLTRGTNNPWLAIIVVSTLFSLMHLSYYGFLSRLSLGIVLGALYYYSGTIWWSILAHFIYNALAITTLYVYTLQGKPLMEAMDEKVENFWGILALLPLIGLFIIFKNTTAKNRRRLA